LKIQKKNTKSKDVLIIWISSIIKQLIIVTVIVPYHRINKKAPVINQETPEQKYIREQY